MNGIPPRDKSLLEYISTHWTMVEDPAKFVLRYGPAIREYIDKLLKGRHDSEDVAQDFLTLVMTRGFSENQLRGGRFRNYLQAAVRNAVIDHLRVKRPSATDQQILEETLTVNEEDDWIALWKQCLLEKSLRALRQHQKANPGNIYYTVLKMAMDHPENDSTELARRASSATGREIRPDGFRQLLHRARRKFAEIVVDEVTQTLRHKHQDELEDELRVLGLDRFVKGLVD